mmetsp:Transcript_121442/g.388405  ORF Transcript_121442/g.388405 Transcript_121442/m.388405 type:complete len:451 (-) Transcript_121442:80-1432(-)
MELGSEGAREWLIRRGAVGRQEKTARRTEHLLVAARLSFVFSHGALAVSASACSASGADASWWAIFAPVWLGDAFSALCCIGAWFASCPYIQLCVAERQARHGDSNPSILTEILPDIVWAIFGLVFVCLDFFGQILFCRYLDDAWRSSDGRGDAPAEALWPSALVFIVVSVFACFRGICIRPNGEHFGFSGAGVLATILLALNLPGGLESGEGWVLVAPSALSAAGLLIFSIWRLRSFRHVLCREEKILRFCEQMVLLMVLLALAFLSFLLSWRNYAGPDGRFRIPAAVLGGTAGAGVCAVATLRMRMALLESRLTSINDRILTSMASPMEETPPPSLGSSYRFRQNSISDFAAFSLPECFAASALASNVNGNGNGIGLGGGCLAAPADPASAAPDVGAGAPTAPPPAAPPAAWDDVISADPGLPHASSGDTLSTGSEQPMLATLGKREF